AVDALGLLLLAQLDAVVRGLRPGEPVLPRRVVPPLDGALLREAARPLQEQLDAFAPALPACCGSISRHALSSLHPTPLGRTAPVVRNRRHVTSGGDLAVPCVRRTGG